MAESAGRYCPLCGEAAGLVDRFCRRCGERLQVPAPDTRVAMVRLAGEPDDEELRRRDHDTSRRWQRAEGMDPHS